MDHSNGPKEIRVGDEIAVGGVRFVLTADLLALPSVTKTINGIANEAKEEHVVEQSTEQRPDEEVDDLLGKSFALGASAPRRTSQGPILGQLADLHWSTYVVEEEEGEELVTDSSISALDEGLEVDETTNLSVTGEASPVESAEPCDEGVKHDICVDDEIGAFEEKESLEVSEEFGGEVGELEYSYCDIPSDEDDSCDDVSAVNISTDPVVYEEVIEREPEGPRDGLELEMAILEENEDKLVEKVLTETKNGDSEPSVVEEERKSLDTELVTQNKKVDEEVETFNETIVNTSLEKSSGYEKDFKVTEELAKSEESPQVAQVCDYVAYELVNVEETDSHKVITSVPNEGGADEAEKPGDTLFSVGEASADDYIDTSGAGELEYSYCDIPSDEDELDDEAQSSGRSEDVDLATEFDSPQFEVAPSLTTAEEEEMVQEPVDDGELELNYNYDLIASDSDEDECGESENPLDEA